MGLNRYSSPVLLNWVEPYIISGVEKTLFYTEVNTNFQVGERVFIISGNYDSDILIQQDKYKKGRDGYKVLFIDNCRIVLDIDYTGVLPNQGNVNAGDNMSDYIKLYSTDSYESYLTLNRQVTTRGGIFDDKFNYNQNNIVFIDSNYPAIQNSWGYANSAISNAPGFFIKNNKTGWTNITKDFFISGSYSIAVSPLYYNNKKVKVMSKSFTYKGFEFKEGFVYKWVNNKWIVDVTEESKYTKAIISKSNFRDGNFNGVFNNGIYGTKNKKIKWTGEGIWNGGTLLNSVWESGTMNSTISLKTSYKSTINEYGIPKQKLNGINNNGYGFNYTIDSEINISDVDSGTIRNTKIGTYSNLAVVENHIMSIESGFANTIRNASFEFCDFSNIHLIGGVVKNSDLKNCKLTNVKTINSNFENSVITESTIISDKLIKILGYDEWNSSNRYTTLSPNAGYSPIRNTNFKVYKFYIGESDFLRLNQGDAFYISGLRIEDNSKSALNFFDKKFRIGSWTEYVDHYTGTASRGNIPAQTFYKRGIESAAFLSTQEDNEYIYNSLTDNDRYKTDIVQNRDGGIDLNPIYQYSIDIFVSMQDILNTNENIDGLNFNYDSNADTTAKRSKYLGGKINIEGAYIIDSNFESGIVENSDWDGGIYINYNNDLVMTSATNSDVYSITINSEKDLEIRTPYNSLFPENYKTIRAKDNSYEGDILFMNSVEYDTRGKVLSLEIINPGSGYAPNYDIDGAIKPIYDDSSPTKKGSGLSINNTTDINNTVDQVQIVNAGLGYSVGDILKLPANSGDAQIKITEVENNIVTLPDSYKVIKKTNATLTLREIQTGTYSVVAGLTTGGRFITEFAENRWGYLSKTKISKTKIKSGLFKRAYIEKSIIKNEDYDASDVDYNNLGKIRSLLVSDSVFKNTQNILSSATYINSHFTAGTDIWENGIIQNSILNGIVFSSGNIKESTWIDGTFNGGKFYNSRTFNAASSLNTPYYYTNNTKSYYKKGMISATISNDRHSWQNGQFNGGEFVKSDWEGGTMNGGIFYNSKWYNGTMNGGIFGDVNTPTTDTILYNGTVNYATVENATIYSKNVNYYPAVATITWNDGIFNSGVFGSDINATAVWNNGQFNSGQFISMAVWKNGEFNGGQFKSGYGWQTSGTYNSSVAPTSYSWQDGVFNGGEFGNASLGTNSTWYQGEFNGGTFKGRVWNFGIFTAGEFMGSGTTAIGGTKSSNANSFVSTYTTSFYGLWRNGVVTDKNDIFMKDRKMYTTPKRNTDTVSKSTDAKFTNTLWLNGDFGHKNGQFLNSVWLGGRFLDGRFQSSAFNPYVNRFEPIILAPAPLKSFNTNDQICLWDNGTFEDGEFYYSHWYGGDFISGTAYGMIWENGTARYMNANNIFWKGGTWKNGTWNGSAFDYDGSITDDFTKAILLRINDKVSLVDSTSKDYYHIWNIFEDIREKTIQLLRATASLPISKIDSPTPITVLNLEVLMPPIVI